jgi:hypothetical protein
MKKQSKIKKAILGILLLVLVVIIAAGSIVAVIAGNNVRAMDHCVEAALAELGKTHTVTPIDAGDYAEMTINGIMKFHVEQYDIENVGNLSIMRVNMGVMQMATVVITPQDKNLPLLSADYMYILNNRKSYLEFYDVVAQKDPSYLALLSDLEQVLEGYDHLNNIETTPAWYADLLTVTAYKGADKKADAYLEKMLVDSLHTYLEHGDDFPLLTEEERAEKIKITVEYTDGLIEKGGISTDVFKDSLGDAETKKFFDEVFFGTSADTAA